MNSKRPVVPEGLTPETRQLAVRPERVEPTGRGKRARLIAGVVLGSIGSAYAASAPVLSCVVIAFGVAVAICGGGRLEQAVSLVASLVAGTVGTYLLFGALEIPMTVVSVLCAYALAWGYVSGRLRTGWLLLAAAAVTGIMIGIDSVSASMQGTSITDLVASMVDEAVAASMGSLDLEGKAVLLETKDQMMAYWPTVYFTVALGIVVCSLFGSWTGARTCMMPVSSGGVYRYDVPLCVAELFAVGVAAQLLGPHLPAWQEETAMVGANVVMCARIVLAQQGISVLLWRMRERRVPVLLSALGVLSAVWLEMSFALASVVGLLDVVANFRHLPRNRMDLRLWPASER